MRVGFISQVLSVLTRSEKQKQRCLSDLVFPEKKSTWQGDVQKYGKRELNKVGNVVVIYLTKWCVFELFESQKLSKRGSQMVLKSPI